MIYENEVYDPVANTWARKPARPAAKTEAAAPALGPAPNMEFDPRTSTWTIRCGKPSPN